MLSGLVPHEFRFAKKAKKARRCDQAMAGFSNRSPDAVRRGPAI
jgi:hypothetical protein